MIQQRVKGKRSDIPVVRLVRMVLFLLLFLLLFSTASSVLARKSLAPPWDMSVKIGGFYNEKENCFDTMYFGSSHMYCSVDPILMEEQTGSKGYILATQKQPLWLSYYYMIEALKTQNPEVVVLEVNMITQKEDYADEGTNYSALDPIPFSVNKIDMVKAAVPAGERRNYLFNIFKYHGRWEELKLEDYKQQHLTETDENRGYVQLLEAHPVEQPLSVRNVSKIGIPLKKNVEYLEKICSLTKRQKIQLVLLKTPSNPSEEEQMLYNFVWKFAEENEIPYADFNKGVYFTPENGYRLLDMTQLGIDFNEDYYDQHHLNRSGVVKFTPIFTAFLQDAVDIANVAKTRNE